MSAACIASIIVAAAAGLTIGMLAGMVWGCLRTNRLWERDQATVEKESSG